MEHRVMAANAAVEAAKKANDTILYFIANIIDY